MKNLILGLGLFFVAAVGNAGAQRNVRTLPKPALAVKTVAIVNNTHNDGVD